MNPTKSERVAPKPAGSEATAFDFLLCSKCGQPSKTQRTKFNANVKVTCSKCAPKPRARRPKMRGARGSKRVHRRAAQAAAEVPAELTQPDRRSKNTLARSIAGVLINSNRKHVAAAQADFEYATKIVLRYLYKRYYYLRLRDGDGRRSTEGNAIFVADWLRDHITRFSDLDIEGIRQAAREQRFSYWAHECTQDAWNAAHKKEEQIVHPSLRTMSKAAKNRLIESAADEFQNGFTEQQRELLQRVLPVYLLDDFETCLTDRACTAEVDPKTKRTRGVVDALMERYAYTQSLAENHIRSLRKIIGRDYKGLPGPYYDDPLVKDIRETLWRNAFRTIDQQLADTKFQFARENQPAEEDWSQINTEDETEVLLTSSNEEG